MSLRYPLNKESAYKTICSNPKAVISGIRNAAALCSLAILPLTLSQTVEFETMSALITTATGLCIGIPAMIAHSYFTNRLNNQLVENGQKDNAISECLDYR